MIAVISGSGDFPQHIIKSLTGMPIVVIGFNGQTDPNLTPDIKMFDLGNTGQILMFLHQNRVKKIIFGGSIRRPSWSEFKLDSIGLQWLRKLGWRALKGDNDLLSGILELLQKEGFEIIQPKDILKELLTPLGCLTSVQPFQRDWEDINRGIQILNALSSYDVGQAIVVQQGLVLGIEGIEGTRLLIQRGGELKRFGKKPVLIKSAKLEQDHRIDLPTIGPETIIEIVNAGFGGIALGAHTTQILEKEKVKELANEARVFIVGIENS